MSADVDTASRPSGKQALFGVAGIATWAVLLFADIRGFFLPDSATLYWGISIAIMTATAAAVLFMARAKEHVAQSPIVTTVFLVAGIFAIGGYFGAELAIGVLPRLYTLAFGTPASRHVTVIEWTPEGGRHCAGVWVAEIPYHGEKLCLRASVARGTILTVYGQQSFLGFRLEPGDPWRPAEIKAN